MENVTYQQYQNAVSQLFNLAQKDTSGARAAAQVILSAYNGHKWQLDITDLRYLGDEYFEQAMTVLRGRTSLNIEPHTVLDNGDDLFTTLWHQWIRYIDYNRWKVVCDECNGRGDNAIDEDCTEYKKCYICDGEGLLIPEIK